METDNDHKFSRDIKKSCASRHQTSEFSTLRTALKTPGHSFLEHSNLGEDCGGNPYAEENVRQDVVQDVESLSDPRSVITISDSDSEPRSQSISLGKNMGRSAEVLSSSSDSNSRRQAISLGRNVGRSAEVPSSRSDPNVYGSEVFDSQRVRHFVGAQEDSENFNDSVSLLDVGMGTRTEQAGQSQEHVSFENQRRHKSTSSRNCPPSELSYSQALSDTEFSTEDVAFTMGTQGYPKVKEGCSRLSKEETHYPANETVEDTKGPSSIVAAQKYSKAVDADLELSQSSSSDSRQLSSIDEDSENIDFTVGTQRYLKVRNSQSSCKSKTKESHAGKLTSNVSKTQKHNNYSGKNTRHLAKKIVGGTEDSSSVADAQKCLNVMDIDSQLSQSSSSDSRQLSSIEDSESIDFTMGTQGYLKVRNPQSVGKWTSNASKTQKHVDGSSSSDSVPLSNADDSEDITFTMGTQGYLKVKDPQSFNKSKVSESSVSGWISKTQKLLDSRVSSDCVPQSYIDDDDSEDISFTMGTQGYLKVKDAQSCRKSKKREASVGDGWTRNVSKTEKHVHDAMLNQSGKARTSSMLASFVSDDDSEDLTFTMGTQGYLKVKDPHSSSKLKISESSNEKDRTDRVGKTQKSASANASNPGDKSRTSVLSSALEPCASDDESEDINFTMGTRGYVKVKDQLSSSKLKITDPTHVHDSTSSIAQKSVGNSAYREDYSRTSILSSILEPCASDDESEDINFTMGTQGYLKVRGPQSSVRSRIKDL